MDLQLEDLLNQLEQGMNKSASDESDKKEEDKKEDKASDKGDKSDGKKEEKNEKEEEGQEKSASEAGAALAREIMEKVASSNIELPQMNKQATVAGQALAQALIEKLASAGDVTTTNGVAPGVVPNKIQVDLAQNEAEGAANVKPMPTGDGVNNHGTINQIFDGIVADALAQGAASTDQVHDTGVAKQEGAVENHAVPNQVKTASENEDEIEKAAAVQELVAQGVDFSDAVALVKQAAEEIQAELEKSAALSELIAQGFDFDKAAEMIKAASAGDVTTTDGIAPGVVPNKIQVDLAQNEAEGAASIKPMPTGNGIENAGTINQIFDAMVADAMSQGAASTDQVHTTGVAQHEGAVEAHAVPSQVKTAAINKLMEAGVDFDKAIQIVKEASESALKATFSEGQVKSAGAEAALTRAFRAVKGTSAVGKGTMIGTAGGKVMTPGVGKAVNAVRNVGDRISGAAKAHPNLAAAAVGVPLGAGAALAVKGNRSQEKKAALDALVAGGVDFDKAAELVSAKALELYGE